MNDQDATAASPPGTAAQRVDYAAFGIDLLRRLADVAPDENVIISPLSAGLALSMLANGATGATLAGIEKALATGMEIDALNAANTAMAAALESDAVELSLANSLWVRAPLLPAFVELSRRLYDAEVESLASAQTINDWVSRKTRGRIKWMMSDPISPLVILCLLNAVYFKGRWEAEFSKANTHPRTFHSPSGPVERPMMAWTGVCGYLRERGFQAVRLPYRGDRFAMYVLLPDARQELANLRERLTEEAFRGWMEAVDTRQLRVLMPRYRMGVASVLNDPLKAMGMADAFVSGAAKLDAMLPAEYVAKAAPYLSLVMQKVFVEVNEEGTEAAATTLVVVQVRSVSRSVQEFVVDRPFIFAIRDDQTGALLFIGQVNDPVTQ